MGTDHLTPVEWPTVICPHCGKRRRVMPSGKIDLHPVRGLWKSGFCRGSGEDVRPQPKK